MAEKLLKSVWGNTPDVIDDRASAVDWDDYRVFAAAAREGSFTKAALLLGIKQPTVSRRIEALEQRTGVRLFNRCNRGPELTDEGERMLKDVEAAAIFLNRAARRAHEADCAVEGECRLAISEGLANAWLIPFFVPLFKRRYPNVVLRIGTSSDLEKSLLPSYDIQLQYAPSLDSEISTMRICMFNFVYFASRDYLAAYGAPKTRDDLADHQLVDVTSTLKARGTWEVYADTDVIARNAFFTNSGSMAAALVASGSALGLLPSYAFLTNRSFVPVIREEVFKTGLHINFPREAGERSPVRAMIDFLKNDVFNRRSMPWFADEYIWPEESWRDRFADILSGMRLTDSTPRPINDA